MGFLNQFTLYDVFLVATGLVLASLVRIFIDSVKERRKLRKLDEMVKVYNESMDTYKEGVIIISDKNEIVFSNKEASRILGADVSEEGMTYLEDNARLLLSDSDESVNLIKATNSHKNITNALIIKEDSTIPVSVNTNKFYMTYDVDSFWEIIVIRDITSLAKLKERVENIGSYKDLLTGLPTRYHLSRDLVSVILRSSQHEQESALGMFSIRDYDTMQTSRGIEKIDILTKNITKIISGILLENETLYRFNCNSFAVVFENAQSRDQISKRLDHMVVKLQNILAGENIKATTMQGLYFLDKTKSTSEQVINKCFKVLLGKNSAKVSDINNSPTYEIQTSDKSKGVFELEKEDFQNAIKNKDFFFFYQPIFDLKTNSFVGVEVLTRLNHKKYGFLVADEFLNKAIEHDMASEITTYLLDGVLVQKKFWSTQRHMDLDMTINLALSDLQTGIFAETLERKLLEHKIDPSTITIDIPETLLSEDFDSVMEEFHMLSKIGVKLVIDHFGKEFVSLKHIEQLPLHAIKIDKSIISNMVGNQHKTRLASSIVSMGEKFGVKVGANHVDSGQIKALLEEIGCDFAQGFYFGKAVPAFELKTLIDDNN